MTSTLRTIRLSTGDGDVTVVPDRLVVAGYTGRDQAAVRRHIEELAAIGVPEPETVPAFYDLDPGTVSTDSMVEVDGAGTSGEIEPVLIRVAGRHYLTVGSDHTDRDVERDSVPRSKAVCPKPIGRVAVDLGADPTVVAWDDIAARSWVNDTLYQEGTLADLLPIGEVLARWDGRDTAVPDQTLVLFGGTLPLVNGTFVPGRTWRMRLDVPGHDPIDLTYHVTVRSN